jgi:hypothetical protein
MNKYEKLIEHIINDNEQAARKLFHQIVVEKSRDIYESLMDEEIGGNETEEMVDDITNEVEMDEEGLAEDDMDNFGDDDEDFDLDSTDDEGVSGDLPADVNDVGDEDLENRVMDLESELEELKAEFDRLMSDEDAEETEHPDIHGMDDLDSDEEFDSEDEEVEDEEVEDEEVEDEEEEEFEENRNKKSSGNASQADMMREYVEKVKDFYKNDTAEGQKIGAPSSEKTVNVNKKSTVAGKNDMGGTAKNLVQGGHNEAVDGKVIEEPKNEYTKNRGNEPHAGKFKNAPGDKKVWDEKHTPYSKNHEREGKLVGADGTRPINKNGPIKGKVR